jgi:hypothetical protein
MSETEIAERFKRETAAHVMEIKHDDGLYRQIRFSAPNSLDWIDLITWPYNLIANGSHGSFHFCRFSPDTEDMFALFRDGAARHRINPGYWAEKVRAGVVESWSQGKFRAWLMHKSAELEAHHPGITEAVDEQILRSDEHSLEYEASARYAVGCFSYKGVRLSFPEEWETDFIDYDWKYLWSCHGVVWGVSQYDLAKVAAVQGGERA